MSNRLQAVLQAYVKSLNAAAEHVRNDAAAAFILENVQHIARELVVTVFVGPEWERHLPLEPDLNEAAMSVGFDLFAPAGEAVPFRGSGSDLPNVGAVVDRILRKVEDHGIAREISDTVLAAAALAAEQRRRILGSSESSTSLDKGEEEAAMQAVREYHDRVVISGVPSAGILGVTNQPNLPQYVVPNGGFGSPLWENKMAEEIVADMTGLLNAAINSAKTPEYWPNHMALPLDKYLLAADPSKTIGVTNETALAHFQRTNIQGTKLTIAPWQRLNGKGTGGTGFGLCYKRESNVISYAAPLIHKVALPPKREVAGWKWAHMGRTAGVLVRRPFAVAFMEGF